MFVPTSNKSRRYSASHDQSREIDVRNTIGDVGSLASTHQRTERRRSQEQDATPQSEKDQARTPAAQSSNNGMSNHDEEREISLALENDKLQKEKDMLATKQANVEKQARELAKREKQLSKKTTEEVARLSRLKAKDKADAKAESDRLARERESLERDLADLAGALARRAKEMKARFAHERRTNEQGKIGAIYISLDIHPVAVGSLRLLEAVVYQLEVALDPRDTNLALIPKITHDLLVILQNMAQYKKLIAKQMPTEEAEAIDTLLNINVNDTIGSISSKFDRSEEAKKKALNQVVPPELLELRAAVHRFQTGKDCVDVDALLSSADINKLKNMFKFDQSVENLFVHCMNLSLVVFTEEYLSVERLYQHLDKAGLRQASDLRNAVQGESAPFNKDMSMLEFRGKALIPALNSDDSQLQEDAVQVAADFANNLTDLRSNARAGIVRPAFISAQSRRLDGTHDNDGQSEDDKEFCSKPGEPYQSRRTRMTCFVFNVSALKLIEYRLPGQVVDPKVHGLVELFPEGYLRALIVNSATFCKKSCNFVSSDLSLFRKEHDLAKTDVGIYQKMKRRDIAAEKVVIIGSDERGSLRRLFKIQSIADVPLKE